MLNFLHYSNWSNLLNKDSDYTNFLEQKRNVLFSQFCIIATASAIIQAGYDLFDGFPLVMAIDLLIAIVLIFGYLLNENRKHNLAKLMVISISNIILFSFAAVVPKGVGIYLLFYPLVAFSFIALDFKNRVYSYGLALLSVLLNTVLVFTNFQPYGSINLQPSDPTISFAINLVVSLVLLSLGIDFLLKISNTAEQKLVANQKHTEKLAREINEKNLSLEKTNQELDRFVYSTSHDLRAPLASILGLINLTELEKDSTSPEIRKYIEMMKERVNRLDDFIQDIIDYSRNSRVELSHSEINMDELLNEVVLHNRFMTNAEKVKIKVSNNIHTTIKSDKNRVFRVLNNLVSNAIKYNDYSKKQPTIDIETNLEKSKLTIIVSDSGKGIRDEISDKVFDMFYRGTDESEGSGLGLYIAQEMVNKMNGTLSFVSKANLGTTFTLVVPLEA
jgi:signal transduction histidine kinase